MSNTDRTLDAILAGIGDFGKFQKRNLIFVCFAVFFTTIHLSFIFTAKDLSYRCKIDGCEENPSTFNTSWLSYAIPFNKNNRPERCERFHILNTTDSCTESDFDPDQIERCSSFVYETQKTSIVNDFDLHCPENLWKLTLIGTINNVGQFLCLPFAGFISDKFGRRALLIGGLVLSGFSGFMRSLSVSYLMFILFEFLDTVFGSGSYSCAFILGVELVGPQHRVLVSTLISSCFTFGEILMGFIAWYADSWRVLLRVMYIPTLVLLSYFWLIPESVRWLLSKEKFSQVEYVLRQAAKTNGKVIPTEALEKLRVKEEKTETPTYPIWDIFKSLPMVLRLFVCSVCWTTSTFLFYGLSLNSVALAGNSYLNFIITSFTEIPAYLAVYFLLDRLGRRSAQMFSFFLTGVACFAFLFAPEDYQILRLVVYLLGKFGATAAFTVIYIFTSELFPTPLRHSMVATCSMFGRLGSMIAPQTPLLALLWTPLPLVLFGAMAASAGLLSLTFPETQNLALPDTIEQALALGKTKKNKELTISI